VASADEALKEGTARSLHGGQGLLGRIKVRQGPAAHLSS
jgi:hypothetical protein